ncbi:transposase (fragment) [Candidatus Nitrospira nitrosa]|uniref:Transposase n=1 Tax=Candidatus Nitrospira nitrosa TaxID=1742972 RepID=A0A0S4LBW7_9BACT
MPWHWEGDRLKGAQSGSTVGTLVERTPLLILLARMDGTAATRAYQGFTKMLWHVPTPLRKMLTYDRGERDGGA